MFEKYRPTKLWFKNKLYGWGWIPATWQGWVVLLIWTIFFIIGEVVFVNMSNTGLSKFEVAAFISYVIFIVTILIIITYVTGEKPRWQWGKVKDEKGGFRSK